MLCIRTTLVLLLTFVGCLNAVGQLPRFRFIGTPDITYPTDGTALVRDGIFCVTETLDSRWDQKDVGHYFYSIETKSWTRLHRLDSVSMAYMLDASSKTVLNDSLLLLSFVSGIDTTHYVCWNFRTDSAHHTFERIGRDTAFSFGAPNVNARGDFYVFEYEYLVEPSYRFISFYRDQRPSDTIYFTAPVLQYESRPSLIASKRGYWLEMDTTVLWTEDFKQFDTIRIPGTKQRKHVVYRLDIDEETLIGARAEAENLDIFQVKAHQPLKTSRTRVGGLASGDLGFWAWTPSGGGSILINAFDYYDGDGLYRCDSSGVDFLGTTETRINFYDVVQNSDRSLTLASASGFTISHDTARTWAPIPLPITVQSRFNRDKAPSITMADDGTLVWAGGSAALSFYDRSSATFKEIPGVSYISGFVKPYMWYRRGDQWLGTNGAYDVTSTIRGVYMRPPAMAWSGFTKPEPLSYTWLDTNFIRSSEELGFICWPPNDTIQRKKNIPEPEWYKYGNIENPFLLKDQVYFIGHDGPEIINFVDLTRPRWLPSSNDRYVRCSSNSFTLTYLYRDSLYSWIEKDTCTVGIAHPLDQVISRGSLSFYRKSKNPDVVYRVREERYFGHDSLIIALIRKDTSSTTPDSVVVMPRDLSTQRVFPLEGIEEPYVYRLLYDKVNRVYYAQTARGVYCTDVATSVDDEIHEISIERSEDAPDRVLWYDLLGNEIDAPSQSGLYLKVTRTRSGTLSVEKIMNR